jgi:5-hydroxyisourate hydrolase
MKSISTHVLDMARGRPAADVPVHLEKLEKNGASAYVSLRRARTDADGRVKDLVAEGNLVAGTYRLTFDTAAYFDALGVEGFYPEAAIVFVVRDAEAHYHVPLLLAPHGYSTYRGS